VQHPVLYIPSQQGLLFNVRVFWVWAVNALLHSVLLFWLPVLLCHRRVPRARQLRLHGTSHNPERKSSVLLYDVFVT
jgi:magnesium-transporting ATPase (P-type)